MATGDETVLSRGGNLCTNALLRVVVGLELKKERTEKTVSIAPSCLCRCQGRAAATYEEADQIIEPKY